MKDNFYRTRKDNIINFEPSGWPIHKMKVRDIIEALGGKLKDGKWIIEDSIALDSYPRVFHDDGMGYGTDEEAIISCDLRDEDFVPFCNFFIEKQIPHINDWLKTKFFPGANVEYNNMGTQEEAIVRDIIKNDDDSYSFKLEIRDKDTFKVIKELVKKESEISY